MILFQSTYYIFILSMIYLGPLSLSIANADPLTSQSIELKSVGDLGQRDKLILTGMKHFSSEQIHDALFKDFEVFTSSHPTVKLQSYLITLRDKISRGYWNHGFLDVQVTIEHDPRINVLRASITEGDPYFCGPIQITGAHHLSKEVIERKLRKVWDPQKRISLSKDKVTTLTELIRALYREKGYYFVEPDVKFGLAQDHRLPLEVMIKDEGISNQKPMRIKVVGNQKNTANVIIEKSGLKPQQRLEASTLNNAQQKLMDTGRLVSATLTPKADPKTQTIELTISVDEHDQSLPLDAPSDEIEYALRRFHQRLAHFSQQDLDLEVLYRSKDPQSSSVFKQIRLITSPQDGALISLDFLNTPTIHLLGSHEGISIHRERAERLYMIPRLTREVSIELNMNILPRDDQGKRPEGDLSFNISLGMRTKDVLGKEQVMNPLSVKWLIDEALFFIWSKRHQLKVTSRDGEVITVEETQGEMGEISFKINTATGTLINLSAETEHFSFKIRSAPHLIRGLSLSLDRPNVYRTGDAISSALEFIIHDLYPIKELFPRFHQQISTLQGETQLLQAVVQSFFSLSDPKGSSSKSQDQFNIPLESSSSQLTFIRQIAQEIISWSDHNFAFGTWPWTLVHGGVLMWIGKRQYLFELQRLIETNQLGPLGATLIAYLSHQFISPELSKHFIAYALKHQEVADYIQSLAPFYKGEGNVPQTIRSLAQVLRTIPTSSWDRLISELSPELQPHLKRFSVALIAGEGEVEAILDQAFTALFTESLRGEIKLKLTSLFEQNKK